MGYGNGGKGFRIQSPSKRKVILSRDVIFDELSMLYSKFGEDLGRAEDVTKKVEFEKPTIRNFSDQKQFKALDEIDQDLQMQPQHQNSTLVEGID